MNHTSPVSVPVSQHSLSHSHSHRLPPLSLHQQPISPPLYTSHLPQPLHLHPHPPPLQGQQRYHFDTDQTRYGYEFAPGSAPGSSLSPSSVSAPLQTRPSTAIAASSAVSSTSAASSRLVPIHRIPVPSYRVPNDPNVLSPSYAQLPTIKQEIDDRPQRPVHPRAYTNPEGYALATGPTNLPTINSLAGRRPHLAPPSALNLAPYPTTEVRRASAADALAYSGYLHPSSAIDRTLRSPHPPLTATLHPQIWPHQHEFAVPFIPTPARPYHSSPLDAPSPVVLPPPIPSAYHSHSPVLPLPNSASPLFIPAPLRFDYSTSPPSTDPHAHAIMPRAAQASRSAAGSGMRRANGQSNGASTSGWGSYSAASAEPGRRKENPIYIPSDTPEIPRKRTRAVAAAEAQSDRNGGSTATARTSRSYANGSAMAGSVTSVMTAGGTAAGKKRKVEEQKVAPPKRRAPVKPAYAPPIQPKPLAPTVTAPTANGQPAWDDAEGHYIVKVDDVIASRYKIIRLLGQGTFGKVVEARDIQTRQKVAIKVIRAVQKYRDASKIEIRVLKALKDNDPENINKCVHLAMHLDYRNHPCLITELYGMSVFDFLKQNGFQPFPEKHIQDFARHLLRSVAYVHSLKLVHTDLKPENILLVSNDAYMIGERAKGSKQLRVLHNTDIRLIDFGSATFENEYHSSVVSTRHYRAPEIILGMPWSYPCDMFSIGCILVEFYTGEALFQTHDNIEHLGMMEVVMGKMPRRMIEQGRIKKPEFFTPRGVDFPNPSTSKSSRKFVKNLKNLKEIVIQNTPHNKQFYDLIKRMLDFDPDSRIDVQQALDHPYFRTTIPPPAR